MSTPVQLTPHQHDALEAMQAFVQGPEHCFILQGGAGTGKTTLMAALARWLESEHWPYGFLAPTGRAARILGDKTATGAQTIHSRIYAFDRLHVSEEPENERATGLRLCFRLRSEAPGVRLFVVDEASMVGDVEDNQETLRFGSGRLLADLIEYSGVGRRSGRSAAPGNGVKLLFVGDPAQLSPVGQQLSPALSAEYLERQFRLSCAGCELTEIHRQEAGSAIRERASVIRSALKAGRFNSFDLKPSGAALLAERIPDSVTRVAEAYRRGGGSSSVLITFSNARALQLNRAVRGRLWGDELADVRVGDQLLVNRNSYRSDLYNGDLVRVLEVAPDVQRRTIRMRGVAPVELSFRQAVLAYRSANGEALRTECLLLENLLHSKERGLSPLEQRALLVDFKNRHPNLRPGTDEFAVALRDDSWFNALQVKYGYALTCHKAQGGEWDTAVVNFESGRGLHNEAFFRWAYTAITRARRTLVTIGAPSFDAYSGMDWGRRSPEAGSAEVASEHDGDPDWDRFAFSAGQAAIFAHHCRLREALQARGIVIEALDHLQHCERYRLQCQGQVASVQYWYRGNGQVSRVAPAAGNRSGDAGLVQAAIDVMQEVLLSARSGSEQIADPFVRNFADLVEQVTADTDIRVVSRTPLPYRLRLVLTDGRRRGAIDFCYDSTPKWTTVQEVGGPGRSQGLLERVRSLLGD